MKYGSCLCGKVKFRFDGQILFFNHCHCSMCRKVHGAAFGSFLHVKADSFEWLSGVDDIKTYKVPNQDSRNFCDCCASYVPVIELEENNVIIPAGLLDTDITVKPMAHIFTDSKASWYDIHDDVPKFNEYASSDFLNRKLTNS